MVESVLVALIAGLCAVAGQWIIARSNKKNLDKEQAVKDALMAQQLENIKQDIVELRDEVKKNNEVKNRTYALETKAAVHEQRLTANEARIKKLEGAA